MDAQASELNSIMKEVVDFHNTATCAHTHAHSHSHTYLQSTEEAEMLPDSESVKEYIVLGTNS